MAAETSVVVANTDAHVCELLARVVEAAGCEALRVNDAGEVVDAVAGTGADAVLLDLGAANLDIVRTLRSHDDPLGADLRIAVVEVGPASARLAWQAGVDVLLTRPFPAAVLGEALAAALDRSEEERQAERSERLAALDG